ncbi:putative lipid II flippase FtsW [Malikia granosa]|uniref:Probable peptidoglycan glycosyltransferase FtsW n=1 Tax=Malikia granosa TaxID=263067 RepID=A0A2S9K9F5_9BURK|nr:putative lipid II flippase FtsW [Malikia granosa]PRD67022.1 putative lipid II flippase FtsW [Malikia granosa]
MKRLAAGLSGLLGRQDAKASAAGDIPIHLSSRDYSRGRTDQWVPKVGFDQQLLWVVVGLLCFGLVMVYSASIALPDNPRFGNYMASHFVLRHGFAILIGALMALLAFQVPMSSWEQWAPRLFLLSLLLLALVLVPFIGKGVNGARRWIALGIMNFQPSELAKFATLLYAAGYMVRKIAVKESFMRAILPMCAAVSLLAALLLAEPDMGAFMVVAVIAMGILFLGGVTMRMMLLIMGVLVSAFVVMIATSPWRRARVFAYLDPFSEDHALGKGYQLSHSLIAIGRGEVFGVGLGSSVEKLHWLPEGHTDFLLAVIGEEFGLVGVLALVLTFFWLTRRIMQIGRQAIALDQLFAGLVAQGVGLWMGFQALINIGVCLGALPTKGLTLPLMSYGGSAILMNLVALAVVLRVDHENRQLMHGGRV